MIYYMTRQPYSNELYHHGIKGQKWGVRRYQNPDGTLTAAGKRRYSLGELRSKKKEMYKSDYQKAKTDINKRYYHDLYEDQLKTLRRYNEHEGDKKAQRMDLRDSRGNILTTRSLVPTKQGRQYTLNAGLYKTKQREMDAVMNIKMAQIKRAFTAPFRVFRTLGINTKSELSRAKTDLAILNDFKTDKEKLAYLSYMYSRGIRVGEGYGGSSYQ